MKDKDLVIFHRDTVEFVTVAAEFCGFLERAGEQKRRDFVDTALKLLPLLYLKASMLPPCEPLGMAEPETFVDEAAYEAVRLAVAAVMADGDDYLDVFVEDMRYSDTPIRKTISEDLADIYQDVKDFVSVYRLGFDETMHDALAICEEHFATYWGQVLVNTMRALHEVKYNHRLMRMRATKTGRWRTTYDEDD